MKNNCSLSPLLELKPINHIASQINRLVDPGAMFLPVAMNMTRESNDYRLYSGITRVCAVDTMIIAINDKITGGVFTSSLVAQLLRSLQMAHRFKLGVIFIVSSGGADLRNQANLFVDTGRIYYQLAQLRDAKIPTLAIVTGTATAGAAYIPGMCQTVIALENAAQMYLAGPVLVKAAIGASQNGEALGGARMHAEKTGLVDYLVEDFEQAARAAESVVKGWARGFYISRALASTHSLNHHSWLQDEQLDLEGFLDDLSSGQMVAFGQQMAPEMVCQTLTIDGNQMAVLATTGPITTQGALKAAQFVEGIQVSGIPMLFIQNTVGFMVGMREEQNGIICAGSRLITAISLLRSPKITLHVGPAYGAGYYAMCGKPYEPDFIISWPRYHLAVMGADNAAKVMVAIKSRKTELSDEVKREIFNKIHEQYTSESRSDFCTKKGFDDCMIDPKDTKRVICRILELLDKKNAH